MKGLCDWHITFGADSNDLAVITLTGCLDIIFVRDRCISIIDDIPYHQYGFNPSL